MGDASLPFEHSVSFSPGEITGSLGLGKLEVMYSELFADVIEDGVITAEERAELERTATALGLDRERLRALEAALQSVYEERHRVRIVEPDAPPPSAPASIALFAQSSAREAALTARVAVLEARVAELEFELVEARSQVAVDVDLSGVDAPLLSTAPASLAEVPVDPEALRRRLAHDPRDVETLRALFQVHARAGDTDRGACVARALVFLGAADDAEEAAYEAHRGGASAGLIRPTTSLSNDAWRRFLFHPDEEVLTGDIFAVVVSAVLVGRVAALRRDKKLPALDPAARQDPAKSTLQAVRCFSWSAQILGMRAPPLYADGNYEGLVEMVPGVPPSTRLGQSALSGRSPAELAFVAGRHLAWYRPERFVRLLVPQIPDLEDIFLAALLIGNPAIPLRDATKRRVAALSAAIEPLLEPLQIDRLRGSFSRFVEQGGRTNLQRWGAAADATASRAGLLLCDDLRAAAAMLEAEDAATAKERVDDLLVFVTSERYASLRREIGIARP